jgi:hypothetical protein
MEEVEFYLQSTCALREVWRSEGARKGAHGLAGKSHSLRSVLLRREKKKAGDLSPALTDDLRLSTDD